MVNMRAEITVRMYMACNIASQLIKQSIKSLHTTIPTLRHKACTIRSNSMKISIGDLISASIPCWESVHATIQIADMTSLGKCASNDSSSAKVT